MDGRGHLFGGRFHDPAFGGRGRGRGRMPEPHPVIMLARALHQARSTQSQTEPQVEASKPPHAWLWGESKLSDVTLVFRTLEEDTLAAGLATTGSSSSDTTDATQTLERPLKRVCRQICFCTQRQPPSSAESEGGQPTPASDGAHTTSSALEASAFKPANESGPPELDLQSSASSLKLHTVVLSSASDYFKTLFTTSVGGWCPDCKVVTQTLEGRELEAAQHVLKFIYTLELPTVGGDVPDGTLHMWIIKVSRFTNTSKRWARFY